MEETLQQLIKIIIKETGIKLTEDELIDLLERKAEAIRKSSLL